MKNIDYSHEYPRFKDSGRVIHRIVAENMIGRKLKNYEVVHHKDGDKTNFRKTNLRVMSRSYYSKLHYKWDY